MSFFDYMHEHEKFFKQKGQLINIPKNQYIVTIYDESPWVYFLLDGLIKVSFTLGAIGKNVEVFKPVLLC